MGSFISFYPTPYDEVETFFELAPLSPADIVYDLGSGDGRLLIASLQNGAGKAVGIELNHDLVVKAIKAVKKERLEDSIDVIEADVMDVDLSEATVVLCYLITAASTALKPKFEAELKPGTRVVIESFPIHGWKPVDFRMLGNGFKTYYLYRMPPDIENEDEDRPPVLGIMS